MGHPKKDGGRGGCRAFFKGWPQMRSCFFSIFGRGDSAKLTQAKNGKNPTFAQDANMGHPKPHGRCGSCQRFLKIGYK